jgi:hypothetical protein
MPTSNYATTGSDAISSQKYHCLLSVRVFIGYLEVSFQCIYYGKYRVLSIYALKATLLSIAIISQQNDQVTLYNGLDYAANGNIKVIAETHSP